MMSETDRSTQTLRLLDGRTLGYAEWGDLNGKPVFYFTSSEASRYSRHPDNNILTDLGIRLYTFDRPGRGLSSPHKGRGLLDWAEDIRQFAEQKNIVRFAMVGHSQGSTHCLVCAYVLPDMVTSLALVTNIAGLDNAEVLASHSRYFRTQLFMCRHVPWLMDFQWNMLRFSLKGKRGEKMLLENMRSLPQQDQVTLSIPGSHDVLFQSIREGLRQGGANITNDFRLIVNDWGFKLEDIRSKVFIWHGEADPIITPLMSRYMAERIPNNEVKFVPDEGNLLIYSHWKEIMSQLVAD